MKYVVLGLIAGLGALALYGVFYEGEDADSADGTREGSKTYAAPGRNLDADNDEGSSSAAGDPAANGETGTNGEGSASNSDRPMVFTDDPVADVCFGLIRDLKTGKVKAEERATMEDRLETILASEKMGEEKPRRDASVLSVSTMIRQFERAGGEAGGVDDFQLQAMKIMASEFARDLYRRLPIGGASAGGHTGERRTTGEIVIPEGYERADWGVLGGFDYEEGMLLPENVRKLHGKKVGIAGYMMTLEEVEDIHEFLLVESLWSCCFGVPPEVHQVFVVTVPTDKGIDFTPAPILVLGKIDIGEEVEDGFVTSVYRIQVDEVKEAQ